ncbi:hypothetical protein EZ428_21630 [Pedobacter frigiditerrae]|uniref:Chaperone of endosialidase n=1 Tax=Pedobacter frigiditerrae TaxID=2530452 RepID=A0A4R0ML89_9SPHI|nr:tail fiber protein [Pedobacter frigiditerrae]TCC87303.1 hypothetical protein EZ428_21630 [Pedobacter frigiditerrae]
MIRTTIKITICLMLLLSTVSWAQTATTITVGGTDDKYYPVTFTDPEWSSGKPTEIYIGRPNVHTDGSLKGSTLANFKYHTTQWGNQSNFISATIERSQFAGFFAGWADATTNNSSTKIVIWLKGGGMSYLVKSVSTVSIAVHDGVQNALPFLEENGPARSYKTTIDSYVITGSMSSSSSLVAGNGTFLANVGIGTPTPQANLDIFRGYQETQTKAFKMFYQGSWGTAPYATGFRFLDIESTEGGKILQLNGYGMGIGYDPPIYNSTDKLYINGNVGIGTNNPLAKLEVRNGNILVKNLANVTNESMPMIAQSLSFGPYTAFGTSINTFTENEGNNSYALQFLTQETFLTGPKEKFRISANGNVGIGTATPNEKLSVNGKIRAKEIKVEPNPASWPDYVFEEDYNITSLTALEKYIRVNKHLPEMPTAKEVAVNGVELGEMNRLLLKKVEELTLHLIEKDKQLDAEIKKNISQEERIISIEKILKDIKK